MLILVVQIIRQQDRWQTIGNFFHRFCFSTFSIRCFATAAFVPSNVVVILVIFWRTVEWRLHWVMFWLPVNIGAKTAWAIWSSNVHHPRRLGWSAWVEFSSPSVCLSVCLFFRLSTQKRMTQECSKLIQNYPEVTRFRVERSRLGLGLLVTVRVRVQQYGVFHTDSQSITQKWMIQKCSNLVQAMTLEYFSSDMVLRLKCQ